MAIITKFPSEDIIGGFKGSIDYYLKWGQPCVRSWPSSPGHKRTPAVEAQWPAFVKATRIWNQLSPGMQDLFNAMAQNGGLSGRDLSMRAYLSGLFTYPTGGIG